MNNLYKVDLFINISKLIDNEGLRDLKVLFDNKQKAKVILLFISLLIPVFELVGIGSIPAFAILIIDIEKFLAILSGYINVDYLYTLPKTHLITLASICLASVFLIKTSISFCNILSGSNIKKSKILSFIKTL